MSIIVQKYGGSSVATEDKLRRVARKILDRRASGERVVVVVSAMGDTTNRLLEKARGLNQDPPARELDLLLSAGERISSSLLSMAIQEQGGKAVALTGAQAGIYTSNIHLDARISEVRPKRVLEELAKNRIVVVAGYQGLDCNDEVTTLGRGGSDTTAVALAAALKAKSCEIYSDVDGVYSADPRLVDQAFRLPELHYAEMQALSRHGARVLHSRAVEYAKTHNIKIHARASFSDTDGTLIHGHKRNSPHVIGVTGHTKLIKCTLAGPVKNLASEVLDACGSEHLYAEHSGETQKELVISTVNIPDSEYLVQELDQQFGEYMQIHRDLGSASVVGMDIGRCSNPQGRLCRLLDDYDETVQGHICSNTALTALLPRTGVPAVVRTLHQRLVEQRSMIPQVA